MTLRSTRDLAKRLADWAYQRGVHLQFIRPGRPVENGFIESFNGRLRDECLNARLFSSLSEARACLALWRFDDNRVRPRQSAHFRRHE